MKLTQQQNNYLFNNFEEKINLTLRQQSIILDLIEVSILEYKKDNKLDSSEFLNSDDDYAKQLRFLLNKFSDTNREKIANSFYENDLPKMNISNFGRYES
tara:strand:- start:4347 stop:4646 length:300 start_codon:yes stop_codon:yes gene_type:complete